MRNNLNFAFISKVLISLGLLILSGCSSTTVETYHPGYYQEGQWETGGYQPAYYDVYGNLHPAKQVQAYYEEGEWHRPDSVPTPESADRSARLLGAGRLDGAGAQSPVLRKSGPLGKG